MPNNGITGITIDGNGNLLGAFAWCDDSPPDGATVYEPGGFNGRTVAVYRAPTLAGHTATVRLDSAADGWPSSNNTRNGSADRNPALAGDRRRSVAWCGIHGLA